MWRVTTGPAPAPSTPECLCWSEDDHLAFCCEDVLRVVAAGESVASWRISAQSVLAYDKKATGKNKRPWCQDDIAMLCPAQSENETFVALSYAPLAATPARGSLLCAAVAHTCNIYTRPESPLQLHLTLVKSLAPLLHVALGHASPPSPGDLEAVRVHRSCWALPKIQHNYTQEGVSLSSFHLAAQ